MDNAGVISMKQVDEDGFFWHLYELNYAVDDAILCRMRPLSDCGLHFGDIYRSKSIIGNRYRFIFSDITDDITKWPMNDFYCWASVLAITCQHAIVTT